MLQVTKTVLYLPKMLIGTGGTPGGFFGGVIRTETATGIRFDLDVDSVTGGNCSFLVQSWDDAKKAWVTELSSDTVSGPGHVTNHIDPRIPAVGASVQRLLPLRLRARFGGSGTAFTASLAYTLGN